MKNFVDMSTMEPAGVGGGGGENTTGQSTTPSSQPSTHQQQQHPPPSPLSGCYLLVVLPEPRTAQHKDLILNRLAKGFLSWDKDSCHVDLEKELQALVTQAPEGEEARNGERLIQYATENLVTEVLIHPQTNTLLQCIRNLLASFTKHRHIIHAGYTFGGNGSWILQDGTFSLADFLDAFSEHEVQRVLRAYENSVTVDIHCASAGDWSTSRLSKEPCTRACRVRVNPDDVLTAGVPTITSFTNYIEQYLIPQTLDQLMEPSDVVGNIRFSHPTLYVFPGGQGDAALFGINGFNMLVDGGFARKACFWDFTRHLDRLDAVLVTRINNSNVGGISSVLKKKKEMHVYPQIGHFFCNLVERRHSTSPDGDKDLDPLIVDLIDIGQEMMVNLRHINLRPHSCYRDPDPINLYHKVGHGTLDMYVLSPSKDSREVREFLAKWNASDSKLFANSHRKDSNNLTFPVQNLVSICALLVWQPANPEDTITRILFPGSTPQHKIFEGFERLKHLDFLKHPVCSAKSLSPSTSLEILKDKPAKQKFEMKKKEKAREIADMKSVPQAVSSPKPAKVEIKSKKITEDKKIVESKVKKIEKEFIKKETKKVEKSELDTKKTELIKEDAEKPGKVKLDSKKKESKTKNKIETKPQPPKITSQPVEKKAKPEKKEVIKSSPTTPKKTLNGAANKVEISKVLPKTAPKVLKPSIAPAKSTKDANNRKVIEQKNIEIAEKSNAKAAAKSKTIERKSISHRAKPVSLGKTRVPGSPAKSTRRSPTASVKSDKESAIRKMKGDKGTTDSSTVSTPSGIEPESAVKLVEKSLTEKSEDLSLDSIESKVLADLKEEREVVEEIEAVLQKAERIEERRKEEHFEGDDEITAEATDKKEEDMTEEDVTAEIEDVPKKEISRKESQELTEEDEYLIVEAEDSMQSGETEHKHHLDEVESEKVKIQEDKEEVEEEKKDEVPEKKVESADNVIQKSPVIENQSEEKIIDGAAMEVTPTIEDKIDSGKKDSDEVTKEAVSSSLEKLDSLEKKISDTDIKPEKDQVPEKLEESQERISTIESGGTTTAPTLPEDERIPLDEIAEDVDEKHVIEDVKEKEVPPKTIEMAPKTTVAPQVVKSDVKVFNVRQTMHGMQRDIVKTPDEVADLPVHEEVDPKFYRIDDFEKDKEEKPHASKDQKGMFKFFGKVADKFEKGIDKLTKKKKDSDKDADDKSSSKSSSPKDPIVPEKGEAFGKVDMGKVFQKVGKKDQELFEEVEPKITEVKVAAIKETVAFIQEELADAKKIAVSELKNTTGVQKVEELKSESEPVIRKEIKDAEDDVEEVAALLEEASKKFKTVKDSLRDSLESLEEKEQAPRLSDLPSPNDIVKDTLTGVVEKLEELDVKEPEKVKFAIPDTQIIVEDIEEEEGPIRDMKEAVRDVGEVLAGTAGIDIDEKPKDVEEIVKKVAEVLKDDFLSEKALFTDKETKSSTENIIIPKKVGITEELPQQEEIEEILESEIVKPLPVYEKAEGIQEVHEEPCIVKKKDVTVTSPITDKKEDHTTVLEMGSDILKSDVSRQKRSATENDRVDVLISGEELVCEKIELPQEEKDVVEEPVIGFEQKLSPAKAELVTVTPGSTPTSPKFASFKIEDVKIVLEKNADLEEAMREFILDKKQKITTEILEYIATSRGVPRKQVIYIIERIIIQYKLTRDSVVDNIEILRTEDFVDSEKREAIEEYIVKEYVEKGKKISLLIIEEISILKIVSRQAIIEILEEIIVRRKIDRNVLLSISEKEYLEIYSEELEKKEIEKSPEKSTSSSEKTTKEDEKEKFINGQDTIIDGFVSIASKESVEEFLEKEKRTPKDKETDDFEAVEQEYKVEEKIPQKLSEVQEKDVEEALEEEVSDVMEADEKFVLETAESLEKKDFVEKQAVEKVTLETEASEVSDTTEKYLDEAKEKTADKEKERKQSIEQITETKLADATGRSEKPFEEKRKESIKDEIVTDSMDKKSVDQEGTVRRMVVTASSEDGGLETEICPTGSITFTKTVTPDDSLKDASVKSTPDKDSLVLDKDSLHSEVSTPDKDSITDKSVLGVKGSEKITPEDSLEKSVVGTHGSQDFEDSLEKIDATKVIDKKIDSPENLTLVREQSKVEGDVAKSPESVHSEDLSPAESVFGKSPTEKMQPFFPIIPQVAEEISKEMQEMDDFTLFTHSEKEDKVVEKSTSASLVDDKVEENKSEDTVDEKSRPSSTVNDKIQEKKSHDKLQSTSTLKEKELILQEKPGFIVEDEKHIDISISPISDEKSLNNSRSVSGISEKSNVTNDKIEMEKLEKPENKESLYQSSSVASEKSDKKDFSQKSSSSNIIDDKEEIKELVNKSRSTSIVSEKELIDTNVLPDKSRSSSIISGYAEDKEPIDRSRSPSKSPISDEKLVDQSITESIISEKSAIIMEKDKMEEKIELFKDKSKSPEKPRPPSTIEDVLNDRLKSTTIDKEKGAESSESANIISDKAFDQITSSSIIGFKLEDKEKESSDGSKSPISLGDVKDSRSLSLISERTEEKDPSDRSKSPSIAEDKIDENFKSTQKETHDEIKSPSEKSRSPSLIDDAKVKSPSNIADHIEESKMAGKVQLTSPANEKIEEEESLSRSKSPSIMEKKTDEGEYFEKSNSMSSMSDKAEEESLLDQLKLRTPVNNKESFVTSKSSNVVDDKIDEKEQNEKSRSASVVEEKLDEKLINKSRSPSIVSDKADEKEQSEKAAAESIVGDKRDEKITDKSRSSSIVSEKDDEKHEEKAPGEECRSSSIVGDKTDEIATDKSRSPSIVSEKADEKRQREKSTMESIVGDNIDEVTIDKSISPSIDSQKPEEKELSGKSRSASVVGDKIDEKIIDKSRSSSIVSEKADEKEQSEKSITESTVGDNIDEVTINKSISPSVVSEKFEEKEPSGKSRSESIVEDEAVEKIIDKSISPSIVSVTPDDKEHNGESTSTNTVGDKLDEEVINKSRSSSIISEKPEEKEPSEKSRSEIIFGDTMDENVINKSRSPSFVSEKPEEKEPSEKSRSASIVGDTKDEETIAKLRSPSIVSEKPEEKEPSGKSRSESIVADKTDDEVVDKSRSPSIVSEKPEEKESSEKSRSASILGDKTGEEVIDKSRSSSIVSENLEEKEPSRKSRSASILGDKTDVEVIDKSRSPSIVSEKPEEKESSEKSRSESIVGDKIDEVAIDKSRSPSIISEKPEEKELSGKSRSASIVGDTKDEETIAKSRSSSIVSEKPEEKEPSGKSRSESIVADKTDDEVIDKSRSPSIVSENIEEKEPSRRSRSASILGDKTDEEVIDKSRSPSIVSEKPEEKEPSEKSRSENIVGDKMDEKVINKSRSSSIVSEKPEEKGTGGKSRSGSIVGDIKDEETIDKSRSPSIFSEKPEEKEPNEKSRSASILGDKTDEEVIDKSRSSNIVSEKPEDKEPGGKSRSGSIVGDKLAEEAIDKSRSSSIVGEKPEEKEPSGKCRSESIVADKTDEEAIDKSRSSNIVSEKPEDKEPGGKSRSGSIVGDKLDEEAFDKSRSSSIVGEKPEEKEPSGKCRSESIVADKTDEEAIDKSRSSNIVSEKPEDKEPGGKSRSGSIVGDKLDEEAFDKSRSSSIVGEKPEEKEPSGKCRSESIVGDKIDEIAINKSRSPSIVSEKPEEKEPCEKSISPNIVCEKTDEIGTNGRSRSNSIVGDKVDERIIDKFESSSIICEKHEEKEPNKKSISGSIIEDKINAIVLEEAMSPSSVSNKLEEEESTVKSRVTSIIEGNVDEESIFASLTSETSTESDPQICLKLPSVVESDKTTSSQKISPEKETARSRSSSLHSEESGVNLPNVSHDKSTDLPKSPSTKKEISIIEREESEIDDLESLKKSSVMSGSASLINEKLDEKEIQYLSKSPPVVEKDKDASDRELSPEKSIDRSRSSSIHSEKGEAKLLSDKIIYQSIEKEISKMDGKESQIDELVSSEIPIVKSRSGSIVIEKDNKVIDRSTSSSIAADKKTISKDIEKVEIQKSRSSSIVSIGKDDKKMEFIDKSLSDKLRSASIISDAESIDRTKSPSSDSEKSDDRDSKSPCIVDEKVDDKLRTHSMIDKKEEDKSAEVLKKLSNLSDNQCDWTKIKETEESSSNIIDQQSEEKELPDCTDVEKSTVKSKSSSIVSEQLDRQSSLLVDYKKESCNIPSLQGIDKKEDSQELKMSRSDSPIEDKTPKDRSRSHSVFESGEKTPLGRSRTASLYDDKLGILEQVKGVLEHPVKSKILEEKTEKSDSRKTSVSSTKDLDLEEDLSKIPLMKKLEVEKYIIDEYITKNKKMSSKTLDEIAQFKSVSRFVVISIIEDIIVIQKLRRSMVFEPDAEYESKRLEELTLKRSSMDSIHEEKTRKMRELLDEDNFKELKKSPSPELERSEHSGPHIDEEVSISEVKRNEIETFLLDNYVLKGKRITESAMEEIIVQTSLPKYIICEIIEEIIIKKKIPKESIADQTIFLDTDLEDSLEKSPVHKYHDDKFELSTSEHKSSGYSTPESKQYEDKLGKSSTSAYVADYESPFHKAFIGGMTEIRTTHITTLSGKSTPDFGQREGTPDSEVTNTTTSERTEKKVDITAKDSTSDGMMETTVILRTTQISGHSDDESEIVKKEEDVVEKDKVEIIRKVIKREIFEDDSTESKVDTEPKLESLTTKITKSTISENSDSISEDTVEIKKIITTVTTTINEDGKVIEQLEDVKESKLLKDEELIKKLSEASGKSTPEIVGKDLLESGSIEHSISPIIRDLISEDRSYSGKSSPDISLPKDIAYSESTGKSTPDIPASPLMKDGATIQPYVSGRSTPDKKSESRSRTATPEGFRSGEVLRTIITTTRTMSDDGDIITTTKEVTESTNEKGETVVLTEKMDVKIDDRLSESENAKSPRHQISDVEDDEPASSPLSTISQMGHSELDSFKEESSERKTVEFSPSSLSSSVYGELPTTQTKIVTTESDVSMQEDFSFKKFTVEKEYAGGFGDKTGTKKYVDEADLDFEKVMTEEESYGNKNDEKKTDPMTTSSFVGSSKDIKSESKKDPLEDWGSPLGLPSPKPPRKFNLRSPIQASLSSSTDLTPDSLNFDAINDWGEPLRLPSPAPVSNEISNKGSPGTPQKERKVTRKVISENIKNKKRSESPNKNEKKLKDSKNKIQPVYMDLTYVPHHGNSFYTALDYFKKIRARYYVFSGTEPSREVYDALLEAKKTWEDKDLEVTMIPTYDTDTLGYWVADNEEALAANHIDLSPSASRCTINLQDHETSCSAYRLEF